MRVRVRTLTLTLTWVKHVAQAYTVTLDHTSHSDRSTIPTYYYAYLQVPALRTYSEPGERGKG